ncbi:MAG TPA: DoxX family membrane protein, partial [Pseudonocardia sp.]|nr:DoxX family membrane protein [Pseudonocardia sp.]
MSVADNASIYQPLRWAYGLVPVVAGLDKFLNLLADWESYLSPAVASLLPVSPGTFMAVVGVIEIAAGVVVLTRWTRLGAYLVMGWLVLIAVNLLFAGHYDVAVR